MNTNYDNMWSYMFEFSISKDIKKQCKKYK